MAFQVGLQLGLEMGAPLRRPTPSRTGMALNCCGAVLPLKGMIAISDSPEHEMSNRPTAAP